MALSQAAAFVENIIGHRDNAQTAQDITNPAKNREKYGHPTEKMKALCWMGKNNVKIGRSRFSCSKHRRHQNLDRLKRREYLFQLKAVPLRLVLKECLYAIMHTTYIL